MTIAPSIYIRGSAGGYEVGIVPQDAQQLPERFADHRSAYGFAVGLRLTSGLRVRDESDAAQAVQAKGSENAR